MQSKARLTKLFAPVESHFLSTELTDQPRIRSRQYTSSGETGSRPVGRAATRPVLGNNPWEWRMEQIDLAPKRNWGASEGSGGTNPFWRRAGNHRAIRECQESYLLGLPHPTFSVSLRRYATLHRASPIVSEAHLAETRGMIVMDPRKKADLGRTRASTTPHRDPLHCFRSAMDCNQRYCSESLPSLRRGESRWVGSDPPSCRLRPSSCRRPCLH